MNAAEWQALLRQHAARHLRRQWPLCLPARPARRVLTLDIIGTSRLPALIIDGDAQFGTGELIP